MSTEHAEGLRLIAEILEAIPELPAPQVGYNAVRFDVWSSDAAERVRDYAKAIGGRWHKNDPKKGAFDATYYKLTHDRQFGPYKLEIIAKRETVCNRVQVGTTVVVEEAREASVKEVPVYEWECVPLLAKVGELPAPLQAVSN